MRRSTIVVAILAATIASASAAPNSGTSQRGSAFQKKTQVQSASTVARGDKSDRAPASAFGASAFTSARNASGPATPVAATPAAKAPKPAVRTAARKPERSAARRQAFAARAAKRANLVALNREVSTNQIGSAAPALAAGANASIHSMVTAAAQRAGVNPALGHAVVKVESMYQPRATGKGGYIGLMQLSYQTARGMGFRGSRQALYEPSANLQYGMRYLAEAVRKSGGHTCAAVSKYQGGHGVRGVTSAGAAYCAKVRRYMASR